MKTTILAGAVESPLPLNPASTVYPDAPIGRVAAMDVKAVLPLKIGLFPGWRTLGEVAEWKGTVEEFWAANEETTWGDIRRMIADIEDTGKYLTGGGAQPCYTVMYVTSTE